MAFKELRDEQWQFIQPPLPPKAHTGRPRADDRRTLNGILYVLTTGCRSSFLSAPLCPLPGVHTRFHPFRVESLNIIETSG
jgi:transposase